MAWYEMRVVLATVIWHFDLELAAPDVDWADQKTYTSWNQNPLPIFLKSARS